MWRHAGGHDAHFIEAEGRAHFLGQAQVTMVNRVESAAEQPDGLSDT